MAKFAVLSNNIVTNIIVADDLEQASVLGTVVEFVDGQDAGIGLAYNPETNTFSEVTDA